MQRGGRISAKMLTAIVVMAVAETAWALYAATSSFDLLLFYGVLVAASAVFFVPGIQVMAGSRPEKPLRRAETSG
jgi:hypothetical protein